MGEKNSLGWFTVNPLKEELYCPLEKTDKWVIAADKGGDRKYFLHRFPQLSDAEKLLLAAVINEFQSKDAKASSRSIQRHLRNYCVGNFIELEREQKKYLLHVLGSSLKGFGALDDILCNKAIEEIALIGIGREKPVYVFHKLYGWLPTNLFFESQQAVCDAVNRMSKSVGRRLTFQTPSINAVLPDGSRLHAAISPVAFSGPCFTIRKFSKEYFTPLQLVENNTISLEAAAFLWMALESDCSMLIAGNTGSGKTTTLNALFSFVPKGERIIVAEETPEINLPHRHVVKLNVVEEQSIGMHGLILNTFRMRPDRIVVGEIRSREEMQAFIDTLLAGQGKGSYCTFHSQSSREVVKRAVSQGVSPMDLGAIDLVLVQKRWDKIDLKKGGRKEVRHVTEISELLSNGDKVGVNRLFEFDFGKGKLVKTGKSRKAAGKMEKCFSMDRAQLAREAKRRERFLKGLLGKGLSLEEFFAVVNGAESQ